MRHFLLGEVAERRVAQDGADLIRNPEVVKGVFGSLDFPVGVGRGAVIRPVCV